MSGNQLGSQSCQASKVGLHRLMVHEVMSGATDGVWNATAIEKNGDHLARLVVSIKSPGPQRPQPGDDFLAYGTIVPGPNGIPPFLSVDETPAARAALAFMASDKRHAWSDGIDIDTVRNAIMSSADLVETSYEYAPLSIYPLHRTPADEVTRSVLNRIAKSKPIFDHKGNSRNIFILDGGDRSEEEFARSPLIGNFSDNGVKKSFSGGLPFAHSTHWTSIVSPFLSTELTFRHSMIGENSFETTRRKPIDMADDRRMVLYHEIAHAIDSGWSITHDNLKDAGLHVAARAVRTGCDPGYEARLMVRSSQECFADAFACLMMIKADQRADYVTEWQNWRAVTSLTTVVGAYHLSHACAAAIDAAAKVAVDREEDIFGWCVTTAKEVARHAMIMYPLKLDREYVQFRNLWKQNVQKLTSQKMAKALLDMLDQCHTPSLLLDKSVRAVASALENSYFLSSDLSVSVNKALATASLADTITSDLVYISRHADAAILERLSEFIKVNVTKGSFIHRFNPWADSKIAFFGREMKCSRDLGDAVERAAKIAADRGLSMARNGKAAIESSPNVEGRGFVEARFPLTHPAIEEAWTRSVDDNIRRLTHLMGLPKEKFSNVAEVEVVAISRALTWVPDTAGEILRSEGVGVLDMLRNCGRTCPGMTRYEPLAESYRRRIRDILVHNQLVREARRGDRVIIEQWAEEGATLAKRRSATTSTGARL